MRIIQKSQSLLIVKDKLTFFILTLSGILAALSVPLIFMTKSYVGVSQVGRYYGVWRMAFLKIAQSTKLVFDKNSGLVQLTLTKLSGKKIETCNLKDISSLELQTITTPVSPVTYSKFLSRVALILKDGREIPIIGTPITKKASIAISTIKTKRDLGNRLSQFLGVPFREKKYPLHDKEEEKQIQLNAQEGVKIQNRYFGYFSIFLLLSSFIALVYGSFAWYSGRDPLPYFGIALFLFILGLVFRILFK